MARKEFNQRALELIIAIVNLGSVSAVAKTFGLTQSYVSKQIKRVEMDWGEYLFHRTGRGMSLTSFGEHVLPEIKRLLNQVMYLEESIRQHSGILAGNVRVGVVHSMSQQLLPRLFADIQREAPGIRLQVVEGFTGALDKQLSLGELDFAVLNRYNVDGNLTEDALGKVITMLVGKPGSPVLDDCQVCFSCLHGLPLVVPPWPDVLRVFLEREAEKQKIKLNIRIEVNGISTLTRIAASGSAFTFLPAMAVLDEIDTNRLAVSKITNPAMIRTVALAFSQRHPLSRASRMVALQVRKIMRELLASSEDVDRLYSNRNMVDRLWQV